MTMALLEVHGVSRAFSGVLAVDNVSMHVDEGETVSIIGPNGAGKTTLFNLITGYDQPTGGDIRFGWRSRLAGCRPTSSWRAASHAPFSMGAYLAT